MSTNEDLERRVAALEAAVAELQRRVGVPATMQEWLEQLAFPIKDEEELKAFDEMVRLGREFREADRPRDDEEGAA